MLKAVPNDGLSCVCGQSSVKPCIRQERLSTFRRTAYVGSDDNVADMLTKPLCGPNRVKFVQMMLQNIYPVKGAGILGED